MRLIVYQPVSADKTAFVEFWAVRYQGYDDAFYEANVGRELTESRILEWFTWKNGTPLSRAKRQGVLTNFASRREELAEVPLDEPASEFLSRFRDGGAIWRIFWLHIWQPSRFPIYDQHVHRAMRFIETGLVEEIPAKDPEKVRVYLDNYMAFHKEFDGIGNRLVDKALWAFGKFIGNNDFPTTPNVD
jgi:hypothetical protein